MSILVGRVNGVPLRIHWTAILGAVFFGWGTLSGGLAWLALIFVHEMGHAILAARFGLVSSIRIHGLGGECRWIPGRHRWAREMVAWGGVLAQLLLFVVVMGLTFVLPVERRLGSVAFHVLTGYNLYLAAFNLLPIGSLDGRTAWRILGAVSPSRLRALQKRRRIEHELELLRRIDARVS